MGPVIGWDPSTSAQCTSWSITVALMFSSQTTAKQQQIRVCEQHALGSLGTWLYSLFGELRVAVYGHIGYTHAGCGYDALCVHFLGQDNSMHNAAKGCSDHHASDFSNEVTGNVYILMQHSQSIMCLVCARFVCAK